MENSKSPVNQVVSIVLAIVAAIVFFAALFSYPGKIDVKVNKDGVQMEIDGGGQRHQSKLFHFIPGANRLKQ